MSPKRPAKAAASSFEATLKRLEEIVDALEQGTVPLDQALDLYEEGITLSRECADRLKQAELRVRKLTKDADGAFSLSDVDHE